MVSGTPEVTAISKWSQHGPFELNGERLLLRGTHRHEDDAEIHPTI
jgi:hypothetical protein